MALSKADKEFIALNIQGVNARMESNHVITQMQLIEIDKKLIKQNGRITGLEEREAIKLLYCQGIQSIKAEHKKYSKWKTILIIIASAVLAAVIMNVGLLEFLKLVK